MKKITLLFMACIAMLFADAQISKKSTYLGGSFGFGNSSQKSENSPNYKSESSNWYISPQFGKAIGENKIVGVFLNYGSSRNESTDGNGILEVTKNSSYGGGLFYRRYFPIASRLFLFGESALGFGIGDEERRSSDVLQNTIDRVNINLGLTPGLSFAAGRKVHLEASLNNLFNAFYQTAKQKNYAANGTVSETYSQKQFNVGANANGFSNLSVGIRWILPSK